MQAQEVKRALRSKRIDNLYHVNTVATALSFIESGGLLSRQTAEALGLPQTPQETDAKDREYGIYNDIFFDSVDIHERASRINEYGPVMFVYSLDLLESLENYDICITKDNPIRWRGIMSYEDKYFVNNMQLLMGFARGNFFQHITVREISVPLPFDYLEEIVIDDPGAKNIKLLNEAVSSIQNALLRIGAYVPVRVRQCPNKCTCRTKYATVNPGYVYHMFKECL